jgi:hypothetical protein
VTGGRDLKERPVQALLSDVAEHHRIVVVE